MDRREHRRGERPRETTPGRDGFRDAVARRCRGRPCRVYQKSATTLLVDQWLELGGLSLYATDDSTGGTPRAVRAPSTAQTSRILLTHSPAFVDEHSAEFEFDLCLAGHTHGGQITAAGLAPVTPPGSGRFVAGWYDTPMGRLYVSRGTGTSLVPARFMCRPELPLFELVRA